MNSVSFHIRGKENVPLLMHNGRLANPLDPFAKEIARLAGARKKTDEARLELMRVEFLGGLYVLNGGDNLDDPGEGPCLHADCLNGLLVDGGKKARLGDRFKAGALVTEHAALIYKGPKKAADLWASADVAFRDVRKVNISGKAVMRCRPRFSAWEAKFSCAYDPDLLDIEQVAEAVRVGGSHCGILDFTPRFGRFDVLEVIDDGEAA